MIIGFNHNVTYRGSGFHVQTEDSGLKNPNLVTLLYHGGTIIASKKTVYADILKVDNLEMVIEDLAKEQHKGMLKSLTHGEFDERITALGIALAAQAGEGEAKTSTQTATDATAVVAAPNTLEPAPAQAVIIEEEPVVDRFRKEASPEPDLEELVYSYLTAGQQGS